MRCVCQELAHFLGRHGGGHPDPPGQHIKSRRARGTFGNARKTTTSAAIRDFPLLRPTNYGVDLLVVRGNLTIKGSYAGSASPYGTFDQGGNIAEWTEGIVGSRSICNSAIQPHDYPHVPAPGARAIESRDEEFARHAIRVVFGSEGGTCFTANTVIVFFEDVSPNPI